MSNSSEFICKCGKMKAWITEGEEKLDGCPKCGRRYYGKYNAKEYTIEAIELDKKHKRRNRNA